MITVFAPAKINLFLHVTGKRPDGYHLLDTVTVFCKQTGDIIHIETAKALEFEVSGPFANGLPQDDGNIVIRAAYELARLCNKDLSVKIRLTKNMPVAAGLGGGSSDAAACVKALLEYWNLNSAEVAGFNDMLLSLGADVPACFYAYPARGTGIGEKIERLKISFSMPAVIVNPLTPSITADVFGQLESDHYSEEITDFPSTQTLPEFIDGLAQLGNDLYHTACRQNGDIADVIAAIGQSEDCLLTRMSGSGASCYGLYESAEKAQAAKTRIQQSHPEWWVASSLLGGA